MDRYAYSNFVFISRSQLRYMPSASMIREKITRIARFFKVSLKVNTQMIGGVHKRNRQDRHGLRAQVATDTYP